MDEAPEQTTGESPYLKLPWPAVAGGLAVMLLLVLGIGLFANRYLRPQTAIQPTVTVNPVAAPPAPATLLPFATPTVAPATATPQQAIAPEWRPKRPSQERRRVRQRCPRPVRRVLRRRVRRHRSRRLTRASRGSGPGIRELLADRVRSDVPVG